MSARNAFRSIKTALTPTKSKKQRHSSRTDQIEKELQQPINKPIGIPMTRSNRSDIQGHSLSPIESELMLEQISGIPNTSKYEMSSHFPTDSCFENSEFTQNRKIMHQGMKEDMTATDILLLTHSNIEMMRHDIQNLKCSIEDYKAQNTQILSTLSYLKESMASLNQKVMKMEMSTIFTTKSQMSSSTNQPVQAPRHGILIGQATSPMYYPRAMSRLQPKYNPSFSVIDHQQDTYNDSAYLEPYDPNF